jgi:phosphoglycerate dehydrogenase-like enzyme
MPVAEQGKPLVVIACNETTWDELRNDDALRQLESFAQWRYVAMHLPSDWTVPPPPAPEEEARLERASAHAAALVVCNGSPFVSGSLLDRLPSVRFVGDFGGDRFSSRIDVEACWQRGVRVIDTNNSASWPVAEWALAFALIGLRNYGSIFRRMAIEKTLLGPGATLGELGYDKGDLTGRAVGMLGFGHIGRRLAELLAPFEVTIYAHDPYVPIELADAYHVTLTTLANALSLADVFCCLVPITPATRGMLGEEQIALLRPGSVFVNVSRGAVVDHEALLERLRRGDLVACIDVFDPEPVPADSPFLDLPNVLPSPHIASAVAGQSRGMRFMVEELDRHFAGHETRFDLLPRTIENRRGLAPGSLRS